MIPGQRCNDRSPWCVPLPTHGVPRAGRAGTDNVLYLLFQLGPVSAVRQETFHHRVSPEVSERVRSFNEPLACWLGGIRDSLFFGFRCGWMVVVLLPCSRPHGVEIHFRSLSAQAVWDDVLLTRTV